MRPHERGGVDQAAGNIIPKNRLFEKAQRTTEMMVQTRDSHFRFIINTRVITTQNKREV